ncbi:MAG: FAD:protein FMN transferase [Granulosicoccus sp.]
MSNANALLLLCLGVIASACSSGTPGQEEFPTPNVQQVGGSTMGTSWAALWVTEDAPATSYPSDVQQTLEKELERINALMSTWEPNSELSLFNASVGIEPVALDKDTLKVIDTALPISRLTSGRYDITLKPIIDLWGFSYDTVTPTPDADAIKSALLLSGYRQLVRVGDTVRKRKPEVAIDVSSLAKGYAVDKLGEVLESHGISRYLVDIGGELRARGARIDGYAWHVGIENPEGLVPQLVALRDAHIASSGSYRNFRIENGKRLSHIIDGATGRPIEHDLVSVSVIHQSTMLADAWATALLVVGEQDALALIEQQGLSAQLTVHRDGDFKRITSPGFAGMLVDQ